MSIPEFAKTSNGEVFPTNSAALAKHLDKKMPNCALDGNSDGSLCEIAQRATSACDPLANGCIFRTKKIIK